MPRLHLVELEDLPWFPAALRQAMTAWLAVVHKMIGTSALFAPIVADALKNSGSSAIVDLCSGADGCLPELRQAVEKQLGTPVQATLTDLYPHADAVATINGRGDPRLRYHPAPVRAEDAPPELAGVRTLIAGFHHLRPDAARKVLADAAAKGRAICVLEGTVRHPLAIIGTLPLPLVVVLTMPLARPLTGIALFFTYVVPILPFLIFWDGLVSNLRTYSETELRSLVAGIEAPGYVWTIGSIKQRGLPVRFPYLVGIPAARS